MQFLKKFKSFNTLIALIIIILGILIDQITKLIVVKNMDLGQSIEVIGTFFQITYIRNTGAAWGLFSDSYIFLGIVTVIALAIFIYLLSDCSFKTKKVYSIGISFMISGTIGNLIDRLNRALFNGDGVVDFFDFDIFDFPVFNVADILLVVGVVLFAIHLLFLGDKDEARDND